MSKTEGAKPSRKQLEARIADLEERNRDLARIVGQQLAQECRLQAVVRDYRRPRAEAPGRSEPTTRC